MYCRQSDYWRKIFLASIQRAFICIYANLWWDSCLTQNYFQCLSETLVKSKGIFYSLRFFFFSLWDSRKREHGLPRTVRNGGKSFMGPVSPNTFGNHREDGEVSEKSHLSVFLLRSLCLNTYYAHRFQWTFDFLTYMCSLEYFEQCQWCFMCVFISIWLKQEVFRKWVLTLNRWCKPPSRSFANNLPGFHCLKCVFIANYVNWYYQNYIFYVVSDLVIQR